MSMKKTKEMFNNNLAGQELIGNRTLERVEEYTYLEQTVNVNPDHDREIKRRIRKG